MWDVIANVVFGRQYVLYLFTVCMNGGFDNMCVQLKIKKILTRAIPHCQNAIFPAEFRSNAPM